MTIRYNQKGAQLALAKALADEDVPVPDSVAQYTMDGTAQGGAVVGGANQLHIFNSGATTEAILVAFGTTQALADAALTLTTDGSPESATTGDLYIPAFADVAEVRKVPVPEGALFYSMANAVDSDTNVVIVSQTY